MTVHKGLMLILVSCFGWLTAGVVYAAEPRQGEAGEQAMMKKWMEFMTPGAEHELLKYKVGNWSMTMEMRMAPDAPVTVSKGTSEMTLIMGGRYLLDKTKSTFDGQPFEGMGITGYDNLKKRFVTVWIDNFGTGLAVGSGTYDKAKKTYTYTLAIPDVVSGDYKKARHVERIVSQNEWVVEMYDTTPEGKEFVTMKGTYKRVKQSR